MRGALIMTQIYLLGPPDFASRRARGM